MPRKQLFRQDALAARKATMLGDIVLVRPVSFTVMTALFACCALLLLLFLAFGSYTKRSTVSGQLMPDTGLLKVYSPQAATVLRKLVAEGQLVERGTPLFILSSERQDSSQGNVQAAISGQAELRQQSLRAEMEKTRQLQHDDALALERKVSGLQAETRKIASQIEGQRSRLALAEEALGRAQELLVQHFVSKEQLQQKQIDLLDQRNRLETLERDQLALGRELATQQSELAGLPLRQQNQLGQLERLISSTGVELTESEARRSLSIVAPDHGIATAVSAEVGQYVEIGKPLLNLVPRGATLRADLYAPSKAIGFVRPGDAVLLRYQAFPYQKFGHARGTVLSVSRTALAGKDLPAGLDDAGRGGIGEPMYRIVVSLPAQTILAYGKEQPLQAGMLLDADILQETRRLYEWVLEPLLSLTGKL